MGDSGCQPVENRYSIFPTNDFKGTIAACIVKGNYENKPRNTLIGGGDHPGSLRSSHNHAIFRRTHSGGGRNSRSGTID
jgi:hypothetical protein